PTPHKALQPYVVAAAVSSHSAANPLPASSALLAWTERYLATPAATRPALLPEGIALARDRRAILSDLIRNDPEAALAAALPRTIRAQLPSSLLAELEELISTRAELPVIQTCFHRDDSAHNPAEDRYRATVVGDREYRVHVYGSRLADSSLPATSLIGIALDGHLAVSDARYRILEDGEAASVPSGALTVEANGRFTILPSKSALPAFVAALHAAEVNPLHLEADSGVGSSTISGRPSQAWTHGDKRLLVIRIDFSDLVGTPVNDTDGNAPITENYVANVVNGTNGVRAFFQQSSFGKTDVILAAPVSGDSTDITSVLRVPNTAASYATAGADVLLHTHARAAATAAGFNLANYDRIALVFSYLGNISGSKIDYAGLANVTGSELWINGSFSMDVVAHELGHTYGLSHANLWKVPATDPVALNGSSLEYGDTFDLMGDGAGFENDFGPWKKNILQWIPDTAVTLAASSGTYRIFRFDSSAANLASPLALKIVRDSTRDYWIGYRRATTSANADNGAYVTWGYNENKESDLLDLTTPGTSVLDAPLALNTTFNDSAAGIAIRPVAQGGTGADEWLDVQVTLQPRLAWSASSYVVNEQGGSAVLTVTRTANSTGTVSIDYSTSAGTAAATTDYTTTSGTLTWLDGDTAPKTVTIPLVADALVEGTETFNVTLASPTGGSVVVTPASATVTIADPGARDPSFVPDFINSTVRKVLVQPDGTLLIAGAFNTLQDASFTPYNYGGIARLTASGLVDPAFNPGSGADNLIWSLARQPDGKILVGGDFTSFNGTGRNRIARLNADGSLDTSFNPGSGANTGSVTAILVQPDGKILIGGSFTSYDGTARNGLVRLLPTGARDTSFANFTGPTIFSIDALALQTDGKLLVGGSYFFPSGNPRVGLQRLTTTGSLDATFNGVVAGAEDAFDVNFLGGIYAISLQPDGQILVAGDFSSFNGSARTGLARLTSTGTLDASFAPLLNAPAYALLALPDGRILIGGDFTTIGGVTATRIARLQSTGALDTAFAAAGGHGDTVEDFALQPDGNVVLAGFYAFFQNSPIDGPVWRLVPGLVNRPGVIQFSADTFAGAEGSSATLTVTRTGGSLGALTIGYSTVAGTATAGTDFTTTSGVLTWASGDTTAKTITVPLVSDGVAENAETFTVNLAAPLIGGAILGARQQAVVTVSSAFSTWQASNFTPLEVANSAISGDNADPDADGLNNLLEFAFGLAPKSTDATGKPTSAVQNISGSDYLTLTFRRRAPALDLAYAVQTSGDLTGAWTANAVQVGSATSNGDGTETVTFRDSSTLAAGNQKRFLRVQIIRTP
ncbi:MAG: hypothetical protein RIQ79_2060, partial [Verrucomicrobiota bacterium]